MRAPPVLEMIMKGIFSSIQKSMALEMRSPTTEPIEPPINLKSIAATTKGKSLTLPTPTVMASVTRFFCTHRQGDQDKVSNR